VFEEESSVSLLTSVRRCYVRQLSGSKVARHAKSTDLQYGLVERPVPLGWPRDRVVVIATTTVNPAPIATNAKLSNVSLPMRSGSTTSRAYHDWLILGLSGIMSEAELHHLKLRLHECERNKALRCELRQPLPSVCCVWPEVRSF
jgi:hypothetical protein